MRVRGFASTDKLTLRDCVFMPGCFDASIARTGLAGIALRLDHVPVLPAGEIKQLAARNGHLWCEAVLDPALPMVAERIAAIKAKAGHGFSVGGYMLGASSRSDGVILIRHFFLTEISLTANPGNPDCLLRYGEIWPEDLQETFDEQARRTPIKITLPPIRYHGEAL
jgi:phage head maturation protease